MKKNFLVFIIFTLFLPISFEKKVNAGSGIAVVNNKLVFNIEPGKSETKSIQIINTSNEKSEFIIYFNDFTFDENGKPVNFKELGFIPESSIKDFVTVDVQQFSLEPKKGKDIFITATIPEDAKVETSKYSVLFATTLANAPEEGVTGVGTELRIAAPIIVNILPKGSYQNSQEILNKKISLLKYNKIETDMKYEVDDYFYNKDEKNLFKKFDWWRFLDENKNPFSFDYKKFSKELFEPDIKVSVQTRLKNNGDIAFETSSEGSFQEIYFDRLGKKEVFSLGQATVSPNKYVVWTNEKVFKDATISGNINLKSRVYIESKNNFSEKIISKKIETEYLKDFYKLLSVVIFAFLFSILFIIGFVIGARKFFKKFRKSEKENDKK
ncbi:MAG: hypothetical protein Fur0024_4470 [Patescibacteria group bacterium]